MNDSKIKKAVIREDLLAITGDFRKAIILNQFIYWSERVSDADKFIDKENEIAKSNGKEERELFYGWIYKTAEELSEEVMLGLSASQIRRYINDLVDLEYISKRTNPNYKWDRTLQYRVNLVNIAKSLKNKGYPLSDYKIEIPDDDLSNARPCTINDEPEKNQSQSSERAIPDTTNKNYDNIDYNTKTTDNSLSNDKDNSKSKDLEPYNSPVSEETKQETHVSKTIGRKTHTPKQAPLKDMPTRAREIADRLVDDTETADKVSDCIGYFLERYKAHRNKEHIHLTNDKLHDVVVTMLSTITIKHENESEMFESDYNPLVADNVGMVDIRFVIDEYFDTKFREKTDYSLVHFTQESVLTNVMNKCMLGGNPWYQSHGL